VLTLPPSYHGDAQSGRLMKIMLSGADALFWLWLSFFRDQQIGAAQGRSQLEVAAEEEEAATIGAEEIHRRGSRRRVFFSGTKRSKKTF
jgi:hypothetical protein